MVSVQVRDVPADVIDALRRAAAARGESVQRYLLSVLREQARIDTTAEVLAEAADESERSGGPELDSAAWVRLARDERDDELAARL